MRNSLKVAVMMLVFMCGGNSVRADMWPASPVNPTNKSQCHSLYSQYMSVHAHLRVRAQSFDCLDKASTFQGYNYSVLRACEAEQRMAWDDVSEAISRGAKARRACFSQVDANKRNSEANNRSDHASNSVQQLSDGVSGAIINTAKNEILKTLGKESLEFAAFQSAFSITERVNSRLQALIGSGLSNSVRHERILARLRTRLNLNPLSSLSIDLAKNLTETIYENGLAEIRATASRITVANMIANTNQQYRLTARPPDRSSGLQSNLGIYEPPNAYSQFDEIVRNTDRQVSEMFRTRGEEFREASVAAQQGRSTAVTESFSPPTDVCDRLRSTYDRLSEQYNQLYQQLRHDPGLEAQHNILVKRIRAINIQARDMGCY